jgi:hypothetical protein
VNRCSFGFHVWGVWSIPVESFVDGHAQHRFCAICGTHRTRLTDELAEDATYEFYKASIKEQVK